MAALTCPTCESNDLLQKIGPIIDSGTTDSDAQITGITTGWNVGFASLSGVNVSRLATRLSGPYQPTLTSFQNFCIGFIFSFLISLRWTQNLDKDSGANFVLWFQAEELVLSVSIACFFVIILWLPIQSLFNLTFLRARRQAWHRNVQALRSEYYCLRDDVIVHQGEAFDVEWYLDWRFKQS